MLRMPGKVVNELLPVRGFSVNFKLKPRGQSVTVCVQKGDHPIGLPLGGEFYGRNQSVDITEKGLKDESVLGTLFWELVA